MSTNKPIYKHEMVWGTVYDTWYEVCVVDVYGQPIKEYMDGWGVNYIPSTPPPPKEDIFNECNETCEDLAEEHGIPTEHIDCRYEEDW